MHLSTIKKARDDVKLERRGRVTIVKHKNSFRLRLKINYVQHNITVRGGITKGTLEVARNLADKISSELALKTFDINNYKTPKISTKQKDIKQDSLIDIWEEYKRRKQSQIAPTTKKRGWKDMDRFLHELPPEAILLENIDYLASHALKLRSAGTLHRYFTSLNAAIKLVTGEHKNLKSQLPKIQRKQIEWFEPEEVTAILEAFRLDTYSPENSVFPHSRYHPYVAFLAMTGCRPEEAIAITWDDLQWTERGCKAEISKAYSKRELMDVTKNHIARSIALPQKLADILKPLQGNTPLFQNSEGSYLDHGNFTKRQWYAVLDGLVADGKIVTRLRPYALRHSYVTNLHYKHEFSLVKIAGLIGDRPETVIKHYTGLKKNRA